MLVSSCDRHGQRKNKVQTGSSRRKNRRGNGEEKNEVEEESKKKIKNNLSSIHKKWPEWNVRLNRKKEGKHHFP